MATDGFHRLNDGKRPETVIAKFRGPLVTRSLVEDAFHTSATLLNFLDTFSVGLVLQRLSEPLVWFRETRRIGPPNLAQRTRVVYGFPFLGAQ